jgi:hypothetical protein
MGSTTTFTAKPVFTPSSGPVNVPPMDNTVCNIISLTVLKNFILYRIMQIMQIFLTTGFLQGGAVNPMPNPQPAGPGLHICPPQRQGDSAISPGTGYPF